MENRPKIEIKNKVISIILAFAIFALGFTFAFLLGVLPQVGIKTPFSITSNVEAQAPQDWVTQDNIEVYPDRVVIKINDASMSRYAPTGSMRPLLDYNSNGIRIVPQYEESIKIGDIITFKRDETNIVHRVIEKGIDNNGTYFITQGDNNIIDDGKVRFSDIEYVTVAIIY